MSDIDGGDKVKIKDIEQIAKDASSPVDKDTSLGYYKVCGRGGQNIQEHGSHVYRDVVIHEKDTGDWSILREVMVQPRKSPLWDNPNFNTFINDDINMFIIADVDQKNIYWIHKNGLEKITSGGGGIKKKRKSKRRKSKRKKSKRKKSKRRKSKRKKI